VDQPLPVQIVPSTIQTALQVPATIGESIQTADRKLIPKEFSSRFGFDFVRELSSLEAQCRREQIQASNNRTLQEESWYKFEERNLNAALKDAGVDYNVIHKPTMNSDSLKA